MRKKQSQVAKVQTLLSKDPNMSAKDMAKQLKLPISRVYVLRSMAKNKRIETVKSLEFETTIEKPKSIGAKRYRENLEAENLKLTEWTQLWRQKFLKLEDDYTQAKVMYLNSQAVVHYLEEKVLNLLKEKSE